jgi:hypothetical protein
MSTRREFLERVAGSTVALGAVPLALPGEFAALVRNDEPGRSADMWDTSWTKRLSAKNRAVFDVPEVESGYGVWRASVWENQYKDVYNTPAKDVRTVLILRHNAIVLAMQQPFWDKYELHAMHEVLHPLTQEKTTRNPALLSEKDEVPEPFAGFALDKFIARGGIVLGCNLAFADLVDAVQKKDSVSEDEARTRALAGLVPGVIMQPSGVFAAVRAQQAGCVYVRAT